MVMPLSHGKFPRLGTSSDLEVLVAAEQGTSVILSYHQLVALINQAKDGRHLTQLGNAEIRAAKNSGN